MSIKIYSNDILMSFHNHDCDTYRKLECLVCGHTENIIMEWDEWEHSLTDCLKELHRKHESVGQP